MRRHLLAALASLALSQSCAEHAGPELPAKVRFEITSMFCWGARVSMRLMVDTMVLEEPLVVIDTIPWKSESPQFFVSPGTHALSAEIVTWGPGPPLQPPNRVLDTTVTLGPDESVTPTIDLYCSV